MHGKNFEHLCLNKDYGSFHAKSPKFLKSVLIPSILGTKCYMLDIPYMYLVVHVLGVN